MKKTYKTPIYKTIDLAGEALMQTSKDTDPIVINDAPYNTQGNGVQLVKGHSAWDDEW